MPPDLLRAQQRVLQAHRVLLRSGLALVSGFTWVFVFQFALLFSGQIPAAFFVAVVVYGISQVILLLTTPFSAAHLRHGTRRAICFGALFAALSFGVLGATLAGYFSTPVGWGLILFGILFGAYRALYWIPYRLQAARSSGKPFALFELLLALLPAFAGVTLATEYLSSLRLLFGAVALLLLSIVPVFFMHDLGEPFEWTYGETFAKLFDRRHRNLALRSTLSGIETATLFLIWPLAVFLIVGGSYLMFGLVMSASFLILLVVRGTYRRLIRIGALRDSLPLDIAFSMSGWILRLAAGTPGMIVFADSYSYVSAPGSASEFISGEHAADSGSYLDEYTALQEIGMAFGRIVMCALLGLLLFTTPLPIALALSFIVAAFAAGFTAALSRRVRIEAY